MGPFEMVVAIIAVITIGKLLNTRMKTKAGFAEDEYGNPVVLADPNAKRLSDEVTTLKERIVVLEKIITDDRGARDLQNEIEKLRGR